MDTVERELTTLEKIKELQHVSIKSKVMFKWDFTGEIKKIMWKVEKLVAKEIISKYWVEYTIYSKYWFKIKIDDIDKWIEKLITCNFTYNKTDEKFWYIDPQFLVNEVSKKMRVYDMWKYPILEHDLILKDFIKKFVAVIEQF